MVVQKGITVSSKSLRENLEAINHYEAVELIIQIAEKKEPLTERILKDIHALVLRGIDKEYAGRYRTVNVRVASSRHLPPDALKVQELMDDYFRFYATERDTIHPVLLAARLHERLVSIHPFLDGNGRTARLIMNLILVQHGYTIVNIAGDNQSRLNYYNTLEQCQFENRCDDFLLLVTESALLSLTSYLDLVRTENRRREDEEQ